MHDRAVDPEGTRLPIKLDSTSNGEFAPVPLSARNQLANRLAHEHASENAKRLGLTRRGFLVSACGAASTLLAFNRANASPGGYFDIPREAANDIVDRLRALGVPREGSVYIEPVQAWLSRPGYVAERRGPGSS